MRNVKIRHKAFETNSSSCHSIYIENGELNDTLEPDEDGELQISGGEFGWEVEDYCDAYTKAQYCVTHIKSLTEESKECQRCTDMFEQVIKEHNPKITKVTFLRYDDEFYPYGYIDHQSNDVCDMVFESPENLRNYLFNKNSILRTDNDNY